jgi:hypothetical protein
MGATAIGSAVEGMTRARSARLGGEILASASMDGSRLIIAMELLVGETFTDGRMAADYLAGLDKATIRRVRALVHALQSSGTQEIEAIATIHRSLGVSTLTLAHPTGKVKFREFSNGEAFVFTCVGLGGSSGRGRGSLLVHAQPESVVCTRMEETSR